MIHRTLAKRDNETSKMNYRFLYKTLLTLLVFSSLFYSCSKEEVDTSDAIKELVADLKAQSPNCACEPYLDQYTWKGEPVYVLAYKGPTCDWAPAFYDANGQTFTLPAGYSFDQFLQESTRVKNTWTCR